MRARYRYFKSEVGLTYRVIGRWVWYWDGDHWEASSMPARYFVHSDFTRIPKPKGVK